MKRGRAFAAEYELDVLGNKPMLSLPMHSRDGGAASSVTTGAGSVSARSAGAKQLGYRSNRHGAGAGELSEDVREKLATVLAKEFSRKVHSGFGNILLLTFKCRGWSSGQQDIYPTSL